MASSAAKRYAQAAFSLGKERGTLDAWQADLQALGSLASNREVAAFLRNPSVPREKKVAVMDSVLPTGQPEAKNLAKLLAERDRLDEVSDIAAAYDAMLRDERGIVLAEVTTAEELSPEAQDMIANRLAKMVGKQVQVRMTVDPNIIGGIIARVVDEMIDGSVVSQLRAMRSRLANAS
ncbi:MAG: F0F1 ATP synthase subunit delta [Ilumatobacteraceae bacterium]